MRIELPIGIITVTAVDSTINADFVVDADSEDTITAVKDGVEMFTGHADIAIYGDLPPYRIQVPRKVFADWIAKDAVTYLNYTDFTDADADADTVYERIT